MKTYNVADYQNWADLSADMTADLNENLLFGIPASHKTLGQCTIQNINVVCNENSLQFLATVFFNFELTKTLALNVLMANKLITLIEPAKSTIEEYLEAFTAIQKEVKEIQHDRISAKHESMREAKELAKEEAKRKAHIEKTIHDFEVMARQDRVKLATGEWYYSLGWLAKHCGVITAKLPDYLSKAFESHFGSDVPKTLVDTSKKTVGGFSKQWSFEFVCSIKKVKDLEVPAMILDTTSDITKGIHNTSFIWDLVDNYGFQFGKTQDVDKIREALPDIYLEYFEKGYAE